MTRRPIHLLAVSTLSLILTLSVLDAQTDTLPKEWLGGWSLDLDSGEPAWMRISEQDGHPVVHMRIHVGSDGPWDVTDVSDGRLSFAMKRKRQKNAPAAPPVVEVGLENGKLTGTIVRTPKEGRATNTRFTGKRFRLGRLGLRIVLRLGFSLRRSLLRARFLGKRLVGPLPLLLPFQVLLSAAAFDQFIVLFAHLKLCGRIGY